MRISIRAVTSNSCSLSRPSSLTGITRTRHLNASADSIRTWYDDNNQLLQDAFPNLNADDREFIFSGITPEEFNLLSDE